MIHTPNESARTLQIIDRALWRYRAHWWEASGIVAALYLPWFCLMLAVSQLAPLALIAGQGWHIASTHFDVLNLPSAYEMLNQPEAIHAPMLVVLMIVQELAVFPIICGAVVAATSQGDGQPKLGVWGTYRRIRGQIGPICMAAMLPVALWQLALMAARMGIPAQLTMIAGFSSWGFAEATIYPFYLPLAAALGAGALIFSLAVPAAVIDRLSATQAWKKSMRLVTRHFWQVAGVTTIGALLTYILIRGLSILMAVVCLYSIHILVWHVLERYIIELVWSQLAWVFAIPILTIARAQLYLAFASEEAPALPPRQASPTRSAP